MPVNVAMPVPVTRPLGVPIPVNVPLPIAVPRPLVVCLPVSVPLPAPVPLPVSIGEHEMPPTWSVHPLPYRSRLPVSVDVVAGGDVPISPPAAVTPPVSTRLLHSGFPLRGLTAAADIRVSSERPSRATGSYAS